MSIWFAEEKTRLSDQLRLQLIAAALAGPAIWIALAAFVPAGYPQALNQTFLTKFTLVVFVYPVLEELTFRGLLQGAALKFEPLARSWIGFSGANLLVSLAFVSLHLLYHPWMWSLAIIAPSLVFGFFRDRTGSTLPGMLLHIWYNAGFYLFFGNL